jgi:acyl carrier protein
MTPERKPVFERVQGVISSILGVSSEEVSESASADTLSQWDSIRHLSLIMALEEEFSVSFSEDEIVELTSVALIVQTLVAKESDA